MPEGRVQLENHHRICAPNHFGLDRMMGMTAHERPGGAFPDAKTLTSPGHRQSPRPSDERTSRGRGASIQALCGELSSSGRSQGKPPGFERTGSNRQRKDGHIPGAVDELIVGDAMAVQPPKSGPEREELPDCRVDSRPRWGAPRESTDADRISRRRN